MLVVAHVSSGSGGVRVVITLLYACSFAFIVGGAMLVLRRYRLDRLTLMLAMSHAESPGGPPLPFIAKGWFPFAFPEEEDRHTLESFVERLNDIWKHVEGWKQIEPFRWGDWRVSNFESLNRFLEEMDMSSTPGRDYLKLEKQYQSWASRASLRTVTRNQYRQRGSERVGGFIVIIGALLDVVATMLWPRCCGFGHCNDGALSESGRTRSGPLDQRCYAVATRRARLAQKAWPAGQRGGRRGVLRDRSSRQR
jgi:hypothetical protein